VKESLAECGQLEHDISGNQDVNKRNRAAVVAKALLIRAYSLIDYRNTGCHNGKRIHDVIANWVLAKPICSFRRFLIF
jgi:hypothetical protein